MDRRLRVSFPPYFKLLSNDTVAASSHTLNYYNIVGRFLVTVHSKGG